MTKLILTIAFIILGFAAAALAVLHFPSAQVAAQRAVVPGKLSQSHAFLENNCAACHTPAKGVEAKNCIVCHANNESLLGRQPTAFHANVSSCTECHREHRGFERRPIDMDHVALSEIGFRQLDSEDKMAQKQLLDWINEHPSAGHPSPVHSRFTPQEAVLNCATCHSMEDRHNQLFGQDCAQCHTTAKWTVPEFRHPSPTSMDCNQCHQAPPSHYMMHFKMVSQKIACKPNSQVKQCYQCHQTTSWNDIKGVGWYKHH